MSRSRKKNPGGGIAIAASDKLYKKQEHRRERRTIRECLLSDKIDHIHRKGFGSPYNSPKDGKQYWADHNSKWMRK